MEMFARMTEETIVDVAYTACGVPAMTANNTMANIMTFSFIDFLN